MPTRRQHPPRSPQISPSAPFGSRKDAGAAGASAPVLLIILIAGGACLWPTHQHPASIALNQAEAARLRQQVKTLQAQADRHMQLALQLEKQSQSPSPAMTRTIVNSRMFQLEIDQAALGLLYEADRIAKDPALRDTATEFYRQIATELPPGAATDIARQRLAALTQRKDI